MSTLQEWIHDLGEAERTVLDEGERVVSKGALNVKDEWRARWSGIGRIGGHPHLPYLPRALSYDVYRREGEASVRAEIGPDKNRPQGALGNIIEFGTINNAPIPGGLPALQAEEPRFVDAVGDLGERLLDER